MTKLNKEMVLNAIKGSRGYRSVVADKCGVTRGAITSYIKRSNGDVRKALEDEQGILAEIAKKKLHLIIEEGDIKDATTLNALKFYLERKHGWVEKKEIKNEVTTQYPTSIKLVQNKEDSKDNQESQESQNLIPEEESNESVFM